MESKVFFADLYCRNKQESLVEKIGRLFDAVKGGNTVRKDGLAAIKLTFSEIGNSAYIRPVYIRSIAGKVKEYGGKPFLTDANTLYRGGRSNSVDHLRTAAVNGFSYFTTGAPVIIADGLKGRNFIEIEIKQKHIKSAKVGAEVYYADSFISAAHVHGHMFTGFAGTFKNIGMGLGSRGGKQMMHSGVLPEVNKEKCIGCGECVRWCPADAITLKKKKAIINTDLCMGCGECAAVCTTRAIAIRWIDEIEKLQERIVEYTYAVLRDKKDKAVFFAFLLDVIPDCLCAGFNDAPIVPDIGILASLDPVAIEQAAFDLVKAETGLSCARLKNVPGKGKDKFKALYPDVDSEHMFAYAESLGMGSRKYTLKKV